MVGSQLAHLLNANIDRDAIKAAQAFRIAFVQIIAERNPGSILSPAFRCGGEAEHDNGFCRLSALRKDKIHGNLRRKPLF
ncbi:MAG: hypothetical protein H6Q04_658 [Acidobacteria bacterium]|jgi:hypothetical protein|nr:hypothetical protein [Acidobacteriota bacterium]